jgi:transposase
MLKEKGININVEHANRIRDFARSRGILAKTDSIDARNIRDYAKERNSEPKLNYHTEKTKQLGELMTRRSQLIDLRKSEKNRLETVLNLVIKESIDRTIKAIKEEAALIEAEIEKLQNDDEIAPKMQLLESIKGIGKIVASSVIAFLPEVGHLEHEKLAALVGVAPFNRDSGTYRGKRSIRGGRSNIRTKLYMSALVCMQHNPDLKQFYDRLRATGKPFKVALIAVIRKLLAIINSVMIRQTPWVEHYKA